MIEDMEERKALLFEPDEKSLKAFREKPGKNGPEISKGCLNRLDGFICQTGAALR